MASENRFKKVNKRKKYKDSGYPSKEKDIGTPLAPDLRKELIERKNTRKAKRQENKS